MSTAKGLLLVLMEAASDADEEFNAWYDTEHIPERAAVPGFETALRYVCISGWPRYMAVYDLREPAVLESEAYRAIGGANLSVWSKRVLANIRGYYRAEGPQLHPGHAITDTTRQRYLSLLRFHGANEPALLEALTETVGREPGTAALRLYPNTAAEGDHVALIEHAAPCSQYTAPAALLDAVPDTLDLVNTYMPYRRR